MPESDLVRLTEYGYADLSAHQLTGDDLARLAALRHQRALTVSETRKGWRITAGATVGLLVLDQVRLLIEPKFAIDGDHLLHWLAYAVDAPVPREEIAKHWKTGPDGYAAVVAAALLDAAEDLLRDGLRSDYRRHRQIQPVLRGRLDMLAQITRRYGQLDQLHTVTYDRDVDIWENHVLHTALVTATRLVAEPVLARALAAAAHAFPTDPAPAAAPGTLYRAQYNRLNARYRTAHEWARLLLCGGGITDLFTDVGLRANTLLLDMPGLWERVTRRMIQDATAVHGARVQPSVSNTAITRTGDIGKITPFRPDVLVKLASGDWLPVDAKYKDYDQRSVHADDVHQLLTYVAGYSSKPIPTGIIVYPRPGDPSHRTVKVAGPNGLLGIIQVVGIDTQIDPGRSAEWLSRQWHRLVT
jgi:5-methylcytosine-specific restriction enzyme subunit McrC